MFVAVFLVVGAAGLWALDQRFTNFATPIDHLRRIVEDGANLGAPKAQVGFCPGADSRPWQWPFNQCQIQYLRVDVTVKAGDKAISSTPKIDFRGALNPLLTGTIVLAGLFTLSYAWRRQNRLALWAVAWGAANYLPYVALGLFTNRIMYIYYFLPALPAVAAAVALLLARSGLPRFVCGATWPPTSPASSRISRSDKSPERGRPTWTATPRPRSCALVGTWPRRSPFTSSSPRSPRVHGGRPRRAGRAPAATQSRRCGSSLVPRALAEGTNPLLTDRLNAPDGVNLMWNTAVPLVALAVAPVTLLGLAHPRLQRGAGRRGRDERTRVLRGVPEARGRICRAAGRRRGLRALAVYGLPRGAAPAARRGLGAAAVSGAPARAARAPRRFRPSWGSGSGAGGGPDPVRRGAPRDEARRRRGPRDRPRPGRPRRAALVTAFTRILRAAVPAAVTFALGAGLRSPCSSSAPSGSSPVQDSVTSRWTCSTSCCRRPPADRPRGHRISRDFSACSTRRPPTSASRCCSSSRGRRGAMVGPPVRVAGVLGLVMLVLRSGPRSMSGRTHTGDPAPWSAFRHLPLHGARAARPPDAAVWLAMAALSPPGGGAPGRGAWRSAPGSRRSAARCCSRRPAPLAPRDRVPRRVPLWDAAGSPTTRHPVRPPFHERRWRGTDAVGRRRGDRPRMLEAYAYVPRCRRLPDYGPAATQLTGSWTRSRTDGSSIVARGGVRDSRPPRPRRAGVTHVIVGPMDHRPQMVGSSRTSWAARPMERGGLEVWPIGSKTPAAESRPRPGTGHDPDTGPACMNRTAGGLAPPGRPECPGFRRRRGRRRGSCA